MKITFTQTEWISEDGFTPRVCKEGETLDIAETAACHAVRSGWAIRVPTNPQTYNTMGEPL